jgi:hypothetical protein
MTAAAPAAPLALKVTEESPLLEALSVFGPAVVPSVHDPTVAMPVESVTIDAPLTAPPPAVTENVTVTPPIGAPN